MEIVLGKTAGFCYGVKRAVESANQDISICREKIYCLGEIVHNKIVTKDLEAKGMQVIEKIEDTKGITIIRAHGVAKEIYEYAEKNKIILKDYTCPMVLKIHKIAEKYENQGYLILLCGNKAHPENIGTISYCGKNAVNIENESDIDNVIDTIVNANSKKVVILSQTTFSVKKFNTIIEVLKERLEKESIILEVENTICNATEVRQSETEKISKEVDVMIIIGGKNSSNTKKLYEIASKNCEKSILIEDENELDINLIRDIKKIGIMAGASTPEISIKNVIKKIKDY